MGKTNETKYKLEEQTPMSWSEFFKLLFTIVCIVASVSVSLKFFLLPYLRALL